MVQTTKGGVGNTGATKPKEDKAAKKPAEKPQEPGLVDEQGNPRVWSHRDAFNAN